jgi:hypothetical protein
MYEYNVVTQQWTDFTLLVQGSRPAPRYGLGFASKGNKIFVFGGAGFGTGIEEAIHGFLLGQLLWKREGKDLKERDFFFLLQE